MWSTSLKIIFNLHIHILNNSLAKRILSTGTKRTVNIIPHEKQNISVMIRPHSISVDKDNKHEHTKNLSSH